MILACARVSNVGYAHDYVPTFSTCQLFPKQSKSTQAHTKIACAHTEFETNIMYACMYSYIQDTYIHTYAMVGAHTALPQRRRAAAVMQR
jgi:hypothetical protein